MTGARFVVVLLVVMARAELAAAQPVKPDDRPPPAVDLAVGYAGFVDDATIDKGVFGGAVRFYLSPRVSVGPEFVYMNGPGRERDLFLTGTVTFDLVSPSAGQLRRVTPFLLIGGGTSRHSAEFRTGTFSSSEGSIIGGGGVRVHLTDRVSLGADLRVGWEPHYRVTGTVGLALR